MTYEYYKNNFKKLTKAEQNSKENREFRDRMFEEKNQETIHKIKKEMEERLNDYLNKN